MSIEPIIRDGNPCCDSLVGSEVDSNDTCEIQQYDVTFLLFFVFL